MKKVLGFLFLGILLISIFSIFGGAASLPPFPEDSSEEPTVADSGTADPVSDAEQTQQQIDEALGNIPIDTETGEFDVSKVEGLTIKAQERVDKINAWLEENVGWLSFIFRLKPSVSWVFFMNVYIFLFFLTILFLNGDDFFFFMEKPVAAYGSGLALFVVLLVTNVYASLAKFMVKLFDLIINTVIPNGIAASIVAFVVWVVVIIVLLFVSPQLAQVVISLPAKVFKGNGVRGVVKSGTEEVNRLRQEREIAENFNQGAGLG